MHAWYSKFLSRTATQTKTHTSLPQTLSKMTLLHKDPKAADKDIYSTSLTPSRLQVYWIYCFLKQCSRKHKLQEAFMVLHASWRRHSTFDPRTVKTTAGTYKAGEKGASLPRWKLADGRGLLLKHTEFISVLFFFFTAFYQPQFDLTPVLPIAALVQYQDLESNQPRRDTQMCSFTAQFLLTQLPHGDIYNTLLLCYFQCHYYITFERVTRLYTREITLKL